MQACWNWVLQTFTAELILCVLYCLVLALLAAPIGYFFHLGWKRRQQQILSIMSDAAADIYLRAFHRNNPVVENAGLWTAQQTPTPRAKDVFKSLFEAEFGRSRFVVPALLLIFLGACLLYLPLLGGLRWFRQGAIGPTDARLDVLVGILETWGFSSSIGPLIPPIPVTAVVAILGGLTWVLYDLFDRAWRDDLTPASLLWSSFRLVVAVPAGYAIGALKTDMALPIAYLLGTLPTDTLMMLGRRLLARTLQDPDAPPNTLNQVQHLSTVDTALAARLAAEGITTFDQLAYADPVKLSIRTAQSFSVVIRLISEAQLGFRLLQENSLVAVRKLGLNGSIECAVLWERLQAANAADNCGAIVTALVGLLPGTNEAGVRSILQEIATDPYTKVIRACWAGH
jgi:hypothetical protein